MVYLLFFVSECGGDITGTEGGLSTPNFPSYYTANLTCTWNVRVTEGKRIQINVLDFESESPSVGQDCSTVDYLEVRVFALDSSFSNIVKNVIFDMFTWKRFLSIGQRRF